MTMAATVAVCACGANSVRFAMQGLFERACVCAERKVCVLLCRVSCVCVLVHRLVSQACIVFIPTSSFPVRASGGGQQGRRGVPPPPRALAPSAAFVGLPGQSCVSACVACMRAAYGGCNDCNRCCSYLLGEAIGARPCSRCAPCRWPLWSASLAELVLVASNRTSAGGAL